MSQIDSGQATDGQTYWWYGWIDDQMFECFTLSILGFSSINWIIRICRPCELLVGLAGKIPITICYLLQAWSRAFYDCMNSIFFSCIRISFTLIKDCELNWSLPTFTQTDNISSNIVMRNRGTLYSRWKFVQNEYIKMSVYMDVMWLEIQMRQDPFLRFLFSLLKSMCMLGYGMEI